MKGKETILLVLPKNIFQYLIGFATYLFNYGTFDIFRLVISLAAYLITYSAIYPFNDFMDYESDKKSKFKKKIKSLARGSVTHKQVMNRHFFFIIIGIGLSTLVSRWFTLIMLGLLLTNFLHSSIWTRNWFKKNYLFLFPNMFVMQYLKYAAGWFAFTTNLSNMPHWLFSCFSLIYLFSYLLYKTDLLNMKSVIINKVKFFAPLALLVFFTYYMSMVTYDLTLPLLLIIPLCFVVLALRKESDKFSKAMNLNRFTYWLLFSVALFILMLNVPVIQAINENISSVIDVVQTEALELLPERTYILIREVNKSFYMQQLDDLCALDPILDLPYDTLNLTELLSELTHPVFNETPINETTNLTES